MKTKAAVLYWKIEKQLQNKNKRITMRKITRIRKKEEEEKEVEEEEEEVRKVRKNVQPVRQNLIEDTFLC